MKKLHLMLAFVITIAGGTIFTSCKKDTTNADPTLVLDASSGASYLSGDVTLPYNTNFFIKFTATGPDVKLDNVTIKRSDDGGVQQQVYSKTSISADTWSDTYADNTRSSGQTQTYTITVTDKDGKVATKTIVVTLGTTNQVTSYTAVLLNQGDSYGLTNGQAYVGLQSGQTNSALVDFVYFYGATNKNTLISPSQVGTLDTVFSSSPYKPGTWPTKNDTKFVKLTGLTNATFDALTAKADLNTAVSGQTFTTNGRTNMLQIGNFVGIKTQAGKYAIARVQAVTNNGAVNQITLDIKYAN